MAPRRSAAAQQEDPCSILKLIMEKGPLSGQTIAFKPESSVRIGRVVRGNTLSIKDPGISSKHLVIQLEPDSDTGRRHWTVTDLGSSNGTVLNGSQVQPSEPDVLSDGDVVKIGESTVIRVNFESNGGESEGNGGTGSRNVRRRGKNQGVELVVIDEDSELGLEGNDLGKYNLRSKRGKRKAGILGSESLKLGDECEAKVGGRRTRGAKVLENGGEAIEEKVENLGKLSLKSDKISSKKEKFVHLETFTHENDTNICEVVELERKGGRNTNMRTRSSKKTENFSDDLKGIASVAGPRVSTRRTRTSRMEEILGEIGVDSGVNVGKRTRRGTRGKSNLPVKATPLEEEMEEELKLENEICEEDKGELETQTELVEESMKSGTGFASMSRVKDCAVGSEAMALDLEKMTLGEWFDFLEVHLPKQIIDATEEMISAMEQNTRKLHDFMLHKKNDKERDELLVDLTED